MIDDIIFFPDHDPGGKVRLNLPSNIISEAIYSPCAQYRYLLHRHWNLDEPRRSIMFLMHNPSTATEDVDDPTVRKCRHYADLWGYNDMVVGNIMAYRATHPGLLRGLHDPVGPDNLMHLKSTLELKPMLICAWGRVNLRYTHAEKAVIALIEEIGIDAHALQINLIGGPYHPLYLPMDITPQPWNVNV